MNLEEVKHSSGSETSTVRKFLLQIYFTFFTNMALLHFLVFTVYERC